MHEFKAMPAEFLTYRSEVLPCSKPLPCTPWTLALGYKPHGNCTLRPDPPPKENGFNDSTSNPERS